jgi:hypothetical protein
VGTPGTLTVAGNVAFQSGAVYRSPALSGPSSFQAHIWSAAILL